MGTADYVAPEQIRGQGRRSRRPLRARLRALRAAHRLRPVHRPLRGCRRLCPSRRGTAGGQRAPAGLPAAVDDVLARAIAKERDDRQPTATAVVAEAAAALGLVRDATVRRWPLALALSLALAAVVVAVALVGLPGPRRVDGRRGRHDRLDRPDRRPGCGDVQGLCSSELGDHEPQPRLGRVAAGRVALADRPRDGRGRAITAAGEPRDLAAVGDALYVASDGQTPFEGVVARYNAITGGSRGRCRLALVLGRCPTWSPLGGGLPLPRPRLRRSRSR